MSDPRQHYLDAAAAAIELVRSDAVASAWDLPSALDEYDVGALAAHVGRAIFTLEIYLAEPEPDPASLPAAGVLDAAGYYAAVLGDADPVDSDLHRGVRQRSAAAAAAGHATLVADLERSLDAQRALDLHPDRLIAVLDGVVVRIRDYYVTRLVELLVHTDDLASSVGVRAPVAPSGAWELLAPVVQQIALARHGARGVVLGLARPERHGPLGAFG